MSMYCRNISSAASHSTSPSSPPAASPPAANASISPLRHRSSPACSLPSAASVGHASDIPYIVLPPAKTRLHPGRLACDLGVWPALLPSLLWGDGGTDLVPDSCVRAFREKYIDKSAVLASADSMDMVVGCARRAGNRRVLSRYDTYRPLFIIPWGGFHLFDVVHCNLTCLSSVLARPNYLRIISRHNRFLY